MQGEPIPLRFAPKVVRDQTRRAAELVYFDCDKTRFVAGYPQSIGGWQSLSAGPVLGVPRTLFAWSKLDTTNLMGIGTHLKYYVEDGGDLEDITPIRDTASLGSNPIQTFIGESRVRISDTSHGANENDFVTLAGATDTGGILAATLNAEHQIVTVVDANTYEIAVSTTASSNATGGGASVTAEYQIHVGNESATLGFGWGAGGWGEGTWGTPRSSGIADPALLLWENDNWGEDLLYHQRGGPIYYYDSSSGARGTLLSAAVGADEVPDTCDQVLVFPENRQALAFGTTPIGLSDHDPMFVRWCKTEDVAVWDPTPADSDAGGFRLTLGSRHMRAVKVRQGALEFTDAAVFLIQYVGSAGYAPRLIADKTSILGPKAANTLNGVGYWMATRGMWEYNGTVRQLPNELSHFVYTNMNHAQRYKCFVHVNPVFNEVQFHYVSKDATEVDSYVGYNPSDGTWWPGTFDRTAGLESGVFSNPRMADSSGILYEHETGASDSTTPTAATIGAYIETSIFAIGNGKTAMRVRSIWPDVGFLNSDATNPSITLSMRFQNRPGSPQRLEELGDVIRTVTIPIEEFTDKIDVNKRGRFMTMRLEATDPGVVWRWGIPHADMISDGQK